MFERILFYRHSMTLVLRDSAFKDQFTLSEICYQYFQDWFLYIFYTVKCPKFYSFPTSILLAGTFGRNLI